MWTRFADRYDKSPLRRILTLDAVRLLAAYLILVVVKCVWVARAEGPVVFGDENPYKTLAQSLALGHGYTIGGAFFYGYPPLYPLVLTPAFLFQDWYGWLLRINVLVSSAVVFPIWWIARQFLPRRESWMAVLLGSITPFHWITTRIVMSENLF